MVHIGVTAALDVVVVMLSIAGDDLDFQSVILLSEHLQLNKAFEVSALLLQRGKMLADLPIASPITAAACC